MSDLPLLYGFLLCLLELNTCYKNDDIFHKLEKNSNGTFLNYKLLTFNGGLQRTKPIYLQGCPVLVS